MPYYINPPPQNPLSRIIAAIIAVFVLVGSVMIGMAALLVVAGVGLVAGIAIWLRVAWIKRRLQKSGVNLDINMGKPPKSGQVIDAEYTVITDRDEHKDE